MCAEGPSWAAASLRGLGLFVLCFPLGVIPNRVKSFGLSFPSHSFASARFCRCLGLVTPEQTELAWGREDGRLIGEEVAWALAGAKWFFQGGLNLGSNYDSL